MILALLAALSFADEGQFRLFNGELTYCSPATMCEITDPGAYYLSQDLTKPIVISADDVYIDLNGYSVSAPAGFALETSSSYGGLTVVNGTLHGVYISGSSTVGPYVFDNVRVKMSTGQTGEMFVAGTAQPPTTIEVRDSFFLGPANGPCIDGHSLVASVIEDSTFRQCAGIYLVSSSDDTIRGNHLEVSSSYGIESDRSIGVRIEDNTVIGAENTGIYVHGSTSAPGTGRSVVLGNQVFDSGSTGIYVNREDGVLLRGNAVQGGPYGLRVEYCDDAVVESNTIGQSSTVGIQFWITDRAYYGNNALIGCSAYVRGYASTYTDVGGNALY